MSDESYFSYMLKMCRFFVCLYKKDKLFPYNILWFTLPFFQGMKGMPGMFGEKGVPGIAGPRVSQTRLLYYGNSKKH